MICATNHQPFHYLFVVTSSLRCSLRLELCSNLYLHRCWIASDIFGRHALCSSWIMHLSCGRLLAHAPGFQQSAYIHTSYVFYLFWMIVWRQFLAIWVILFKEWKSIFTHLIHLDDFARFYFLSCFHKNNSQEWKLKRKLLKN